MGVASASRCREVLSFALRVFALGVCGVASAQTPAVTTDNYEDSRVQSVLAETHQEIDEAPSGKRIAFIRLVRHDVFVPEEVWPVWPNMFHTLTREAVIQREYLFARGDTYSQALLEETERNLRALGIFALVRVVAVKSPEPNSVGIVVHTRDIWSLRVEQDFQVTGTVLDRLLVQATERNFAGRNKAVVARLQVNPITFSLGEIYIDRRVFLGEHRADQVFDVFFNRSTGAIEGSQGQLVLTKPFYNLAQSLSYKLDAQYITKIARVLRTGQVADYDVPETDAVETIPRVWDDRSGSAVVTGSYRFGQRFKHMLTAGAGYRDRSVTPNEQTRLLPEQRAAFRRDVLPFVRRELFPSLTLEVFETRFEIYRDLGSFGQSENVRVGPTVSLGATLPLRAWGSSTDSVTFALNAGYVLPLNGGLLEATIGGYGRYENGVLINQQLSLMTRGATPFMLGGRVVFRALWDGRRRDRDNTTVTLGGDNGLRGYPSQALIGFGASRILTSFEYRSRPITWSSVQVGVVLFYDAGTVYDSLRTARMHYAVGAGLRGLLPQFNRYAMRLDIGTPLDQKGFQIIASFGSNQAIPLTASEDEAIAATY